MATKRKFSPAQLAAQKLFAERARSGALKKGKRKANPAKKTVSEKISQLVHEGYPQKQAVAIALSEQASGKVKSNPTNKIKHQYTVFHRGTSNVAGRVVETSPKAAKEKMANRLGIPTLAYLVARKGERLSNPDKAKPRAYVRRASQATGAAPSKRLVTRRKMALTGQAGYFPNPKTPAMMTGYQVICMHPKKHVIGVFKTMPQAKAMAKALADYGGVPYGIKKVKIHKMHFDLAIM